MNNPVNFVDRDGKNAESILYDWARTMWILCVIDLHLPVGEAIYVLGLISLGLFVIVTNTASTPITNYNDSKANESIASQNNIVISGGAASPKPPKKDEDTLTFSKEFKADTTYNKNGVRIDYEYNGNGTGNIHVHTKQGKFHYDSKGFFKTGPGNSPLAPSSVQQLLHNSSIVKAIMKALYIIKGLGGVIS